MQWLGQAGECALLPLNLPPGGREGPGPQRGSRPSVCGENQHCGIPKAWPPTPGAREELLSLGELWGRHRETPGWKGQQDARGQRWPVYHRIPVWLVSNCRAEEVTNLSVGHRPGPGGEDGALAAQGCCLQGSAQEGTSSGGPQRGGGAQQPGRGPAEAQRVMWGCGAERRAVRGTVHQAGP